MKKHKPVSLHVLPVSRIPVLHLCAHLREDDAREIRAVLGDVDPDAITKIVMQPGAFGCVGLDKDYRPLFTAGLAPSPLPGIMDAWAFGTEAVQGQIIRISKECKRVMDWAIEERGVRSIRAHSQASHMRAHRWLEMMDFELTEELPHFGVDGSDFYLYERRAW